MFLQEAHVTVGNKIEKIVCETWMEVWAKFKVVLGGSWTSAFSSFRKICEACFYLEWMELIKARTLQEKETKFVIFFQFLDRKT
jgi:hypothetical protein